MDREADAAWKILIFQALFTGTGAESKEKARHFRPDRCALAAGQKQVKKNAADRFLDAPGLPYEAFI